MAETRWLTSNEAAKALGIRRAWILRLCQRGRIQGARKLGIAWMIPDPPVLLGRLQPIGRVTTVEAAEILGLKRQRVVALCKLGDLKGAVFEKGHWSIPFPIERLKRRSGKSPTEEAPAKTPCQTP